MSDFRMDELKKTLLYIKDEFGLNVFTEHDHLMGLLGDLSPELRSERAVLRRISKLGILNQFAENTDNNADKKKQIIASAADLLSTEDNIDPETAGNYIKLLADVFSWNNSSDELPKSYDGPIQSAATAISIPEDETVIRKEEKTMPAKTEKEARKSVGQKSAPKPVRKNIGTVNTGKKNYLIVILPIVVVLLIAGAGGYFLMNNARTKKRINEIYESIEVNFSGTDSENNIVIETGEGEINTKDYISADSKIIISADPESIDISKPGETTVLYTATVKDDKYGDIAKEFQQTFVIADSQAPVITIRDTEIKIKTGESLDLLDNIISVEDSRDGQIAYRSDKDGSNGAYYTLSGSVNTGTKGVYPVTVYAEDSSGNSSEMSFDVRVQTEERFVAIPSGCTSARTDYDKLYSEMEQYGKEYTSEIYGTKDEMRVALREFERGKYPNRPCQVYPGLYRTDGESEEWMFYDYNPWGD